jgi:hypothetical protein
VIRVFTLTSPASRRSPFLLAAAVAMAVPGFLITACSGQSGAAASQAETATTASRSPDVAPGRRQTSTRAVRLLNQAAQAAITTSYQGEEVVTRWDNGTGSVLVSDISHVGGGQTVTSTLATGTTFSSQPYLSADTDGQAPEGVLGVTQSLVQLLERHYVVVYAGTGSAGSRSAQVVEAWRGDGSIAARFWLDDATKLPLEREIFDSTAHVISQDVFLNVRFVSQAQDQSRRRPVRPVGRPAL